MAPGLPQFPPTMEGTLRQLRLVHFCLMFAIILYFCMMQLVVLPQTVALPSNLFWGMCGAAALALAVGQMARSKFVGVALEKLQTRPDDPAALGQWRMGVIVSDALAEAVALFGFAIHILGGATRQVAPFFVVSFVAMLAWWPRRP